MSAIRPRRSALYLPASNVRAIEKARTLDCDVVILDLEDAVAPDMKNAARQNAVEAVRLGGFGRRELVVRANGLDTPWGEMDLAALAAAAPDAVLVPKVNNADDVLRYDKALSAAPARVGLWAMVETAACIFKLGEIGETAGRSRLTALVLGTNDLAKETGASLDVRREPFLGALGLAIAAARANGLVAIDGVFNDMDDEAGFDQQCRQGVAFGFDGKTLIHPRQIDVCNRCFSPSDDELQWSKTIIAAFELPENADKGALRVDGKMVERLHLHRARQSLAIRSIIGGGA